MPNQTFPRSYWDPKVHQEVLIAEFVKTDWETTVHVPDPAGFDDAAEARAVLALLSQRGDRMAEIKAQALEMHTPFFRALMFNDKSHRYTVELVFFAIYGAASVAAVYWKDRYERARPSQYEPALDTPIDVPGHSAYPSGHSTQAHLVAHILSEIAPAKRNDLFGIAARVAKNREIAGVHYASDSQAGAALAAGIFGILMSGQCKRFQQVLEAARREWA